MNVTPPKAKAEIQSKLMQLSQFPFWDFGECNRGRRPCLAPFLLGNPLNSLFGISVNVTNLNEIFMSLRNRFSSQFPFWDFGECNEIVALYGKPQVGKTLNSLFGISVNVTGERSRLYQTSPQQGKSTSQFPFWDFGECNGEPPAKLRQQLEKALSIPFLGFR